MANYCSRTARESKDDRSFLDTNKWPNFQHVWMISMTPSEIPLSANVFRDVKLFSPESWWFNAPPESSILSRLNYRLSLRASFVVPFSPSLIAFVSRTHSSPPSAFTSGNANAQIRYTPPVKNKTVITNETVRIKISAKDFTNKLTIALCRLLTKEVTLKRDEI